MVQVKAAIWSGSISGIVQVLPKSEMRDPLRNFLTLGSKCISVHIATVCAVGKDDAADHGLSSALCPRQWLIEERYMLRGSTPWFEFQQWVETGSHSSRLNDASAPYPTFSNLETSYQRVCRVEFDQRGRRISCDVRREA
jgi:hypothetical protein